MNQTIAPDIDQMPEDPRAESIRIVEEVLADMRASNDVPTIVVFHRHSDGSTEQHICGITHDVIHMIHTSMCHNKGTETIIELALQEHYMCQMIDDMFEKPFVHDDNDEAPF